jgi:peptide/nickel transport system permease protein
MTSYIVKRLLLLILTLFFVSIIVFFLVRFVPGSAMDIIESKLVAAGLSVDEASQQAIAHKLGLDVPAPVQYVRWIGGILTRGDFGNSIMQGTPVMPIILQRMPVTFELGILALIIALLFGIPIGTYSAIRQDTTGDYITRSLAILFIAIPAFWTGMMVMIFPTKWWGWSPPLELVPFTENPIKNLGMFIIPATLLGLATVGSSMRITRTMMLEVMRQDYIKTAWSKGLTEMMVVGGHAIKNAFIPVITLIGAQMGMLIGGSVIIEQIFVLPGMGQLALNALNNRDYPIIAGITLITAVFVMLINLIVDISYTWLDPRVRYQ